MSNAVLVTTLGFGTNYRVDRASGPVPIGAHEFRRQNPVMTPTDGITLRAMSQHVVLQVTPHGSEQWVGEFWGGVEGLDGVFATPNADTLCVVMKGQGYWVPVHEPTAYEVVRSIPIKRVLPVQSADVLIFISYTRMSAYGPQGFIWETEDLTWDGLEIRDVAAGTVHGTAWDSPAGHNIPFSVDIATGKAEGGSSPATYGAKSK